MKNTILILVGAMLIFASTINFVIEGQEAIAVAQQVKKGSLYLQGRGEMMFYRNLKPVLLWTGVASLAFGVFGKLNPKQSK